MDEFDFIRQLRAQVEARTNSPRVTSGIGDDAAVIQQSSDRDLIITTDLLVEGIDFLRAASTPRLLGQKALAVSLSDVAAMGARPRWSLVSVGISKIDWRSDFKDDLFAGYLELADRYGVHLAGGDVSEANHIVIDSIVVGEVNSGHAVLRSTMQPGDQVFVTGNLGGAAAGLKLINLGARLSVTSATADDSVGSADHADDEAIQALLLRQLAPEARVGWGIVLGEERLATAMIDLSDGLSSDLHHLCAESKVGATIDAGSIPLDENVKRLCGRRKLDALALALHGGEDFELLFTVSPENVARLPKAVDGVSVAHIGEVTSDSGSVLVQEKNHEWELQPQGFQHFSD